MKCDIQTAKDAIIGKDKPVIFIDTCSLIDIVRVPVRSNINISHLEGAKRILKKANSNEISIVLTTTVEEEFHMNLSVECTSLERHITKQILNNHNIINVIENIGLSYDFSIKGLETLKITEKLQEIAQDFFNHALILERNSDCDTKAHNRVEQYQAPSKRGKSESKDCLIIEHYLKLASELRSNSFSKNIVFVTSNTTDFGSPQMPNPPLLTQFANVTLIYCNNFQWALQEAVN